MRSSHIFFSSDDIPKIPIPMRKRFSRNDSTAKSKKNRKRDEALKEKIHSYIDAFTVHGLTRVFKAPKGEAILWMVVLLLGIILTVVVLYILLAKFFRYETYTEIKSVVTDKNYFPSLSICDLGLLQRNYFKYCGEVMGTRYDPKASKNTTCDHAKIPRVVDDARMVGLENNKASNGHWSNGVFEVLYCYTWDAKECNSERYFKSKLNVDHACITWNFKGDLLDLYGHVEMSVKLNNPLGSWEPHIFASPHDPEIKEIDMTKKVNLDSHKFYELKLVKTKVKRLPKPYPSNCSSYSETDILPGAYSRRTCVESYKMLHAYKVCGDTFDYMRPYIPRHIKDKYSRNSTVIETRKCIRQAVKKEPLKGECPFPCHELDLGITSSYNERRRKPKDSKWIYNIALQFQHVDYYKIMEEKALYSTSQLMCEVGGFVGLVMGASLLSFVEIIVCGGLYVTRRVYQKGQAMEG